MGRKRCRRAGRSLSLTRSHVEVLTTRDVVQLGALAGREHDVRAAVSLQHILSLFLDDLLGGCCGVRDVLGRSRPLHGGHARNDAVARRGGAGGGPGAGGALPLHQLHGGGRRSGIGEQLALPAHSRLEFFSILGASYADGNAGREEFKGATLCSTMRVDADVDADVRQVVDCM